MRFCRKCHTVQDDNVSFCPDCGTKLIDAHRRGEEIRTPIREENVKPSSRMRVKAEPESNEKFQYKQPIKMPQVNLPKFDFSKVRERLGSKKVKIGAALIIAVFVASFVYVMYGSSLQVSFSAFLSKLNVGSLFPAAANKTISAVATNTTNTTVEKKCSTVIEQEEVKTAYIYKYKYSILTSGYNPASNSALIRVENLEGLAGTFAVTAEFKVKIGGALINASLSDVILGGDKKTFDVPYPGTEDVMLNKPYVDPAADTRYNTSTQNKTVTKCS